MKTQRLHWTLFTAGGNFICGIDRSGNVQCWGIDSDGQNRSPAGYFVALSAGWEHACAVDDSGRIECWGSDDFGQARPPAL